MISHVFPGVFVGCRKYGLLTEHIQKEKKHVFLKIALVFAVSFLQEELLFGSQYIVILEATQRGNPLTGLKI